MWARILCTSAPRDAARATVHLCTQLGHLHGHCLYNSSASTWQECSTAAVLPHDTGLAVHTNAETSVRANQGSSQPASRTTGSFSSSTTISSLARSAGVIFRHALFTAPPCMWAAQTPRTKHSSAADDAEGRKITTTLTSCRSLADLSDVFNEWGPRFDAINAAAAVTQYAKVGRSRSADTQLRANLLRCWLQQLPSAGVRQCANVLWSLSKLGTGLDDVWEPTFDAFLARLQQDMQAQPGRPQHLSNTLLASARLRKQPAPDQLAVLMQAVLLPEVLAAAEPQALSNIVWALGKLCQLEGWQGGVSEQAIQQLLGPQQLQQLSSDGTAQAISNVLLGLTYMSTTPAPVVSKAFAQQCSRQLLADTVQCLITSKPQHIGNTFYACGELGLADAAFLEAAAATAASWVPNSLDMEVRQVATACAKLQFRHQGLMTAMLQRGQQLLQPLGAQGRQQRTQHSRGLGQADTEKLVARLCSAVSHLDMQQLAPQALQLVSNSGIVNMPDIHKAALQRLWVFHSWLLQHQLAGGQGLTGLLTQQQLQRGQKEVALFPDLI